MSTNLFLSNRLELLANQLIDYLEKHPVSPLTTRTILTPGPQIKQWLFLEIAKRKSIAMGIKFVEIEQLLPRHVGSLEMFCNIYRELGAIQDPSLLTYLGDKPQRKLDLAGQLSSLFFSYGQYGKELFLKRSENWQQELLHKLFAEKELRLPVQLELKATEPIICFGIDSLPSIYWDFLSAAPSLAVFLFSPCAEFWEDLCSDRERRNLNRYWKRKGASSLQQQELDAYLRNAPKNLANWGKLGRETLREFDRFHLHVEENYSEIIPDSSLKTVQFGLLTFQEIKEIEPDESVKISLTGTSLWKEVECLRDEILRLKVPFHEISVLAPDIEPYVPLIEFVFGDLIPYKISGFDMASQSSFRQGLLRLAHLPQSRWSVEEVLTLLETPAFYRKQVWDEKQLELFREWISFAKIQWGFDETHRNRELSSLLGEKTYEHVGTWEKGIDRLIDSLVYLQPLQINADQLEEFLSVLLRLKTLDLNGEKTLKGWADCLEKAANEFLVIDKEEEADSSAFYSFQNMLQELRDIPETSLFPFSVIQRHLIRPCPGQIHTSQNHAVRIGSLEEGASLPAKALFLIGMNEENFPRTKTGSSLDLLKGKVPDLAEKDRYLFLQAISAAEEILHISYCHLSSDEGKPIGPSIVVAELLSQFKEDPSSIYLSKGLSSPEKNFAWPPFTSALLPKGELTVSVSDLRKLARHPWKFYLQKTRGIYVNEPLNASFGLQKGLLLKTLLEKREEEVDLPRGAIGKVLEEITLEETAEFQMQMKLQGIEPLTLVLQENCKEPKQEGSTYTTPAIELQFDELTVRIVGEVKMASHKGYICQKDDLSSLLKVWPEAIITAVVFNAPRIWSLKSGKERALENPQESLKAFVEYYFHALNSPSPLLPGWADALLRKGILEFEKQMEKGSSFEDPILDWVRERTELSPDMYNEWNGYLKLVFSNLASLYPTRGKSHATV